MPACRCEHCQIDWPPELIKKRTPLAATVWPCPVCDHKTTRWMHHVTPISESDAKRLMFERYYADREAKRMAEVENEIHQLPEAPPGP